MLVIDLPLNNESNDPADGLCLPNDLHAGDFLAFEMNRIGGFGDGGCYTIAGVEFFESETTDDVGVVHATVAKSLDTVLCPPFDDCNENGIPDQDELDGELDDGKIIICHLPPGNPLNPQTIAVAPSAVSMHLGHGDHLGRCEDDRCEPEENGDGGDTNGNGPPDGPR